MKIRRLNDTHHVIPNQTNLSSSPNWTRSTMYLISTRKENPRHKYLGEKKIAKKRNIMGVATQRALIFFKTVTFTHSLRIRWRKRCKLNSVSVFFLVKFYFPNQNKHNKILFALIITYERVQIVTQIIVDGYKIPTKLLLMSLKCFGYWSTIADDRQESEHWNVLKTIEWKTLSKFLTECRHRSPKFHMTMQKITNTSSDFFLTASINKQWLAIMINVEPFWCVKQIWLFMFI